ncbi:MAG: alpha-glucosidase [Anaerofustis sp.]
MNKKFTPESRIKDVLENPIGSDLVGMIVSRAKLGKAMIDNPVVKNMKLKSLVKLSKGKIDEAFLEVLCQKMNTYSKERVIPGDAVSSAWWKEAVVYQIYPRSFMDSNGDGIGDLNGIRSKLDYLKELGVNVIWLCPVYDSPNDDNGYDIRNYKAIMKEFGTMEEFDALLSEVHERGMRLIMDLVLNHTSDEHEWFQKALSDKESLQHDFYYFRPSGEDGTPPNNWGSLFSGPAWEYLSEQQEWYLHLFSKKQPDLNWENPNLRHELYQMINWWLTKGVDGFRLDVISFISKQDGLPDGNDVIAELTGIPGVEHYFFGPRVHQYLREMNLNTFGNYDVMTVGETPGTGIEMSKFFTEESRRELNMIFNFDHLETGGHDRFEDYDYDLNELKDYHILWQTQYGKTCRNTIFFDNHDNPRLISKIGADETDREILAKMLAMMQFTLTGTPFVYQGDELGMTNTVFDSIDDFRDVESLNLYRKLQGTLSEEAILDKLRAGSRDHARTPMQWSAESNAGFSTGEPWIKVNPDYIRINAEQNLKDENSVYHFYRRLIALRKEIPALIYGDFIPVRKYAKDCFAYYKTYCSEKYYVELNLSGKHIPKVQTKDNRKLILSNYDYHNAKALLPYEANLFEIVNPK